MSNSGHVEIKYLASDSKEPTVYFGFWLEADKEIDALLHAAEFLLKLASVKIKEEKDASQLRP